MIYDLLIIGGGINGAGIANDAAGRGLSVYLCEMNDFASGTSSHSSQLIHGGLRYLEQYDFGLVRKALKEREILLHKAPHLIHPLAFVMPYDKSLRPWWMLKLGLWFYDHLAKKTLPSSVTHLNETESVPLIQQYRKGFKYYDCWGNDARLVIANIKQAHQFGASVNNYHQCILVNCYKGIWEATIQNTITGDVETIQAKAIVNAAGPWADKVNALIAANQYKPQLRLVKGSHIIVKKWYSGKQGYLLQTKDTRVIFVIPYGEFAIIGTTEQTVTEDALQDRIDRSEIKYLLELINQHFTHQLSENDILHTYSGVRPLYDDGAGNISGVSREYHLQYQTINDAPLLNIYGGKITSYRILAEQALEKFKLFFPSMKSCWTAKQPLPGGNFDKLENLYHDLQCKYPWLDSTILNHYINCYGTQTIDLLANSQSLNDLGQHFGHTLYQKEIDYLLKHEWARKIDDIIWRRTKYGLYLSKKQEEILNDYIQNNTR